MIPNTILNYLFPTQFSLTSTSNKFSLSLSHTRLIKLGLSIDEDEEEGDAEDMPELETDDIADSSTMEEVD